MIKYIHILCILSSFKIARVKYYGGGDWYNDPEIIPNISKEIRKRVGIDVDTQQAIVELSSSEIFNYPMLFLTGHGKIVLSEIEIKNLRKYLQNGGFLYIDDDYGLDKYIRKELKKVFPDKNLLEIPFEHPIYHIYYDFPDGLPKIHEHYKGPPKGYGIFLGERLVVFYTYNTNISDGWTDRHNDPPDKREQAIKMGINIILYAITN